MGCHCLLQEITYTCLQTLSESGEEGVPQRKIRVLLPAGTRRGNRWRAGQAPATVLCKLPSPTPSLHPVLGPREGRPAGLLSAQPGRPQEGTLGAFGHSSPRSAFLPGSLLTTSSVFVFTELFHSCFIWRPQRGKEFWFLNCTF